MEKTSGDSPSNSKKSPDSEFKDSTLESEKFKKMTEEIENSNFQENSDEIREISTKRSTSTTSASNNKQNNNEKQNFKISSSKNSNNPKFFDVDQNSSPSNPAISLANEQSLSDDENEQSSDSDRPNVTPSSIHNMKRKKNSPSPSEKSPSDFSSPRHRGKNDTTDPFNNLVFATLVEGTSSPILTSSSSSSMTIIQTNLMVGNNLHNNRQLMSVPSIDFSSATTNTPLASTTESESSVSEGPKTISQNNTIIGNDSLDNSQSLGVAYNTRNKARKRTKPWHPSMPPPHPTPLPNLPSQATASKMMCVLFLSMTSLASPHLYPEVPTHASNLSLNKPPSPQCTLVS
jgi:hypothetical protein